MLYVLFEAFAYLENNHKLDVFSLERSMFLHACATCSELPSIYKYQVSIIPFTQILICTKIVHLTAMQEENLNYREWQPDCTPVDKYHFTWINERRSRLP